MWIDPLLNLIFIPNGRCPVCYRVIFFSDKFICHECEGKLEIIKGKKCCKCGKEIREEMNYCSDCISHEFHFEKGFSLYHYEGSVKNIIHKIKFSNSPQLGEYMGKHLGKSLEACQWIRDIHMIVPVPLHENRQRSRGFNQSEKISQGIVAVLKEVHDPIEIELNTSVLVRVKDTPHQIDLSKEQRFKNIKRAFEVIDEAGVRDKVVLLIDDVYTTGATIESCSVELMRSGAQAVYFAVLASGKAPRIERPEE